MLRSIAAFFRGLFGRKEDDFEAAFAQVDAIATPASGAPITMSAVWRTSASAVARSSSSMAMTPPGMCTFSAASTRPRRRATAAEALLLLA